MAEELGKIEKPDADRFISQRKLFLVPLLFSGKEAPAEYQDMFNRYWEQVSQQVSNLESKIGKVKHIYHESITSTTDEEVKVIERLNPACHRIVTDKVQDGAVIEATEDKELTEECLDWQRSLIMGFISHKVANIVSEFYLEASKKRYEFIARHIDQTLKENEAGIIFIQEGHRVQFPADIEVFSVAPPVLDEIHRWQRESAEKGQGEEPDEQEPGEKEEEPPDDSQ